MNFLGLADDFELLKEVEEDKNLYYYIVPNDKDETCKHCGSNNFNSNGYRSGYRHVRDTNYKGKFVGLMVKTPRYTCKKCSKNQSHSFKSFPSRKGMTHRLIDIVGKEGLSHSYQDVADKYGLNKQNVKDITDVYAESLEKHNRYLIKTPKNLAVLIIPMAGSDRLFFIDLDLNAISDIQSKVDYIHFSGALEMFDKTSVNIVLTEPHIELNKWLDLEIRNHQRLIYGPSVSKLLEEEFRKIFKRVTLGSSYSLDKSPIESDTNQSTIKNAERNHPEIKKYNNLFFSNENSCPNEGGFGKFLSEIVHNDFTNSKSEFSHYFIKKISSFSDGIKAYDNYAAEFNDVKINLGKIIRTFEEEGYGYSYKGLRSKVLYGTQTMKMPRYVMPNPSSHGMENQVFETPALISGFSVSILKLLDYIEK